MTSSFKDDWFEPSIYENPLDSMPIATDKGSFDWEDTAPSEYEPPMKDDDWFIDKPQENEETIHEKMYKIATDKYNPFSIGGSENCHSDIDCPTGGSEQIQKFTPENDPYGGY